MRTGVPIGELGAGRRRPSVLASSRRRMRSEERAGARLPGASAPRRPGCP